jgi:exopolyphosphatase/guanosine-5'-triphosphate,3'-diphosphate pyrophosphatase
VTVARFVKRYTIDREHAARVAALATDLYRRALGRPDAASLQLLEWAATLHEIGMSVSHIGFHKHAAYILQHADMPGFSAGDQGRLALLVFGCRGGLAKVQPALTDDDTRVQLLALRLAVLFHHARAAIALPRIPLKVGRRIALDVSPRWLASHPLTAHLLAKERSQWSALGYPWKAARD